MAQPPTPPSDPNILTNKQKKIADALTKIQIDQLHKSTLNFSNQSFEIKKLWVVTLTALGTIVFGLGNFDFSSENISLYCGLSFSITLVFWMLDGYTYYYQKKLRYQMIEEEHKIYQRHDMDCNLCPFSGKPTIWNAAFNPSQRIYHILIVICFIILVV